MVIHLLSILFTLFIREVSKVFFVRLLSNKSKDVEFPHRCERPHYLVQLRQIYGDVNSGSKSFGNWERNRICHGRKFEKMRENRKKDEMMGGG